MLKSDLRGLIFQNLGAQCSPAKGPEFPDKINFGTVEHALYAHVGINGIRATKDHVFFLAVLIN